jgi:hypothetical protein
MSMLTPPGMGGKYRITGNQYPRMRRPRGHRRFILAAVAAVAVAGLIGWGTVQLIDVFGGIGGAGTHANAAKGPHCAPGTAGGAGGALPKPGAVTVNVYNATNRGGLAKNTADELKRRGFQIGTIGNAPANYNGKVQGTALLLGGPKAQGALKVLGTELAAGATKTDPTRTGASNVDLIIGDGFASLDPPQAAAQAQATIGRPAPAPSATAGHC